MQTEFKGITKRTKKILAQDKSKIAAYKQEVKGLDAEDLVAFANSESGGVLFIGVSEPKKKNRRRTSVGCEVSDTTKLEIMGKALSCSPPIQIEIFIENLSAKPFYRVEIPSGGNKPYCTQSGTYVIRGEAENNPLHPAQLLKMFLEREDNEFQDRFARATGDLESHMQSIQTLVKTLEREIKSKIEGIAAAVDGAEDGSGNTKSIVENIESSVITGNKEVEKLQDRLKALLLNTQTPDPVAEKVKAELEKQIIEELSHNEELLKNILSGDSVHLSGGSLEELTKDDIGQVLNNALKKIREVKGDA